MIEQSPYAIEVRDLTKRYGQFVAVDRLSLAIRPGELFAFLGPNGAGKTTTIKMLVGLLSADAGLVQVCGHPMGRDGQLAKAQIAYVPDQPFLYDKLSGKEFLNFVGQMYGMSRSAINQRMAELTVQLDMAGYLEQLTETYSHGMKQRVALAGALLHNPRVLIIDEPMVGLDPRTVRTVRQLLRQMTSAGGTVFMTTHTLGVAESMADRIGIIHHGHLIAVGTLSELRAAVHTDESLEDIFLKLTDDGGENTETVPNHKG